MSKTTKLEVYLPSLDKDGQTCLMKNIVDTYQCIIHFLLDQFGGCTEYEGRGFWRMGERTITEDVKVIVAYGTELEMESAIPTLQIMLGEAKLLLNQSSWAYALDNVMYFI